MNEEVLFSVENRIATITLNRPERHNAINQALLTLLYDYIEEAAADKAIQVVIITGNGKSFCSGIDLEAAVSENLFDPRGDGRDMPDIMAACSKPVIGAVNGHTITGGFELALNCDFLIASEKAFFTDTHARVGIHPGWGMTQLLQQAIGVRRARQMSFSCEPITAATAREWGLVNEVVPHEMLMPRTRRIAGNICRANPDILSAMRALIGCRHETTHQGALSRERKGFRQFVEALFKGADA
jgi:enoyl-CoA hydratase